MAQKFNEIFIGVWNKHAPIITRRIRKNRTPWMTKAALELEQRRDYAYKKFLSNRSDETCRENKTLRNAVTNVVRLAKRDFFLRGARAGSRLFWRHIKSCTSMGSIKQHLTLWPNHNSTAAKMSANRVNNHFVDSIADLINTAKQQGKYSIASIDVNSNLTQPAQLSLKYVTATQIRLMFDALPSKAATGIDNISVTMLKKSPMAVMRALEIIFNKSIISEHFPETWKHAIVTPVYKKGDVFSPSNYRPISLLSTISKVFEKLVNEQLRDYLSSNNIISRAQHDFCQGRFTQTALLQLSKMSFSLKLSKQHIYITTLDYSRAFDTISLEVLCDRLRGFMTASCLHWFKSYLLTRCQSTKYCDAISDMRYISTGVPEGSVVGSTLFALYINPLLNIITHGSVLAYADDITIVSSGATLQEAKASTKTALASIYSWSASNGLILNTAKCYTMYIAPCSRGLAEDACNLKLNGSGFSIDTVGELKILGFTITSDLNWSVHAKNVRQSVTKIISVLAAYSIVTFVVVY